MKLKIFISFTNYHNYCIEDIIESNVSNNELEYIIITNLKFNNTFHANNIKVFNLKKMNTIRSVLKEIFTKSNKKILLKLFNDIKNINYEEIEVSIPHYNNITSNYIMTNISTLNHHIIKSIYPDGIAIFYPSETNRFLLIKKFILSLLIGQKMKFFFSRDLLNPFNEINFYYSYLPEITYNPKNLVIKRINSRKGSIKGSNIIILGYGKNSFRDKFIDDYLSNILKITSRIDHEKLYYKPHPSIDIYSDVVYGKLSKRTEVYVINTKETIESILKSIGATTVISFASSGLITLKMIYDDQVDCYYYGLNELINSDLQPYFENMFRFSNVRNLEEV